MSLHSLLGRRVVVTRPETADGPMHEALQRLGAEVAGVPVLDVQPLDDDRALRAAITAIAEADWLLLTSPRAVDVLDQHELFSRPPAPKLRVAVVGERTAQAVRELGWPVHLVPDPAGAIPLLVALEMQGVGAGTRVVFPASARARSILPEGLRARGAHVEQVVAYRPTEARLDADQWRLLGQHTDALIFNSPSAVSALNEGLAPDVLSMLKAIPAAVQGPTTAEAARWAGWTRVVEATPRTFTGLAEALAREIGPASPALETS